MAERRQQNQADQVKFIIGRINEEYAKLEECWAALTELGDMLRRLGSDAGQRLLTRD